MVNNECNHDQSEYCAWCRPSDKCNHCDKKAIYLLMNDEQFLVLCAECLPKTGTFVIETLNG